MSFVVQIAVTLISWFAIMFISTNLIGLLVRGLVANRGLDEINSENKILVKARRSSERGMIITASLLIIAVLAFLYYFWNVGLVIAALLVMVSRIPDLIWEIKSKRKLELEDMRKPMVYKLSTLLSWASLPMVWVAIYQM